MKVFGFAASSGSGKTTLLARLAPCDLVLVEGFKKQPIPKIEVYRAAASTPLLFRPLYRGTGNRCAS